MVKQSRATLKGLALAKLVAEIHQGKGLSPAEARDLVIVEWLLAGDTGPFIAWAGEGVGPRVLQHLADMLSGDPDFTYHLVIKRHRGPPKKPALPWRDIAVAMVYHKHRASLRSSEIALEQTAVDLGMSVSNVRRAVTWFNRVKRRSLTSSDEDVMAKYVIFETVLTAFKRSDK
jgi:hypothetical protein